VWWRGRRNRSTPARARRRPAAAAAAAAMRPVNLPNPQRGQARCQRSLQSWQSCRGCGRRACPNMACEHLCGLLASAPARPASRNRREDRPALSPTSAAAGLSRPLLHRPRAAKVHGQNRSPSLPRPRLLLANRRLDGGAPGRARHSTSTGRQKVNPQPRRPSEALDSCFSYPNRIPPSPFYGSSSALLRLVKRTAQNERHRPRRPPVLYVPRLEFVGAPTTGSSTGGQPIPPWRVTQQLTLDDPPVHALSLPLGAVPGTLPR